MNFDILIDGPFKPLVDPKTNAPWANKFVISVINGFQDGKWRSSNFNSFVWDNIKETALSERERQSLIGQEGSLLAAAVKSLRLTDKPGDPGRGSEIAEIVMYGVMKHHFGALPVVPKIFYKQNSNDYAKGADSVHIIVDASGGFTLWLGEAKFYSDIDDARLDKVVMSVKNALDSKKISKENSIITNIGDLDALSIPHHTREEIKQALSQEKSLDELKPKLHVPILLLHQCKLTGGAIELNEGYKKAIVAHHMERAKCYFSKQIGSLVDIFKYADVKFHLILLPVPDKKSIVDNFLAKAAALKDD